jgi:hypothetical protein
MSLSVIAVVILALSSACQVRRMLAAVRAPDAVLLTDNSTTALGLLQRAMTEVYRRGKPLLGLHALIETEYFINLYHLACAFCDHDGQVADSSGATWKAFRALKEPPSAVYPSLTAQHRGLPAGHSSH